MSTRARSAGTTGSAPIPRKSGRSRAPSNGRQAIPATVNTAPAMVRPEGRCFRTRISSGIAKSGEVDARALPIATPRLPLELTATAWAHTAKQAALKQNPQAAGKFGRAGCGGRLFRGGWLG